MNLTVYSCITGGYDNLKHLLDSHTDPKIKYVLFTEGPAVAGTAWEIRPAVWQHETSSQRTSRFHKLNAHILFPEAELTMWIDGALQIKPDAQLWGVAELMPKNCDVVTFKHPQRDCVYDELAACVRLKKDDPRVMQQQIRRYQEERYPAHNGMVETSCLLRRHTPSMALFNAGWWTELAAGSVRDQLSFNYTAWKLKFPYGSLPGCRDRSPYFTFKAHKA
jgi:hypothetical protein